MNLLTKIVFINFIIIVCLNKKMEQLPLSHRIVGGTEASVEDYPFICCIVVKFKEPVVNIFSGGAAIIGKFWAITAAHCVYDFNDGIIASEQGFVRGNTTYWDHEREGEQEHLIVRYVIHEDYKTDQEDNDIALLQVREPFDGLFEKPILFAPSNYKYNVSSLGIAMGWGTTKESVEPYTVSELRHVAVNLMEHQFCYQLFSRHNVSFSPRMICCSAPNKDACINDSGGPLIQYTEDNENALLIGKTTSRKFTDYYYYYL
ncbi:hypothetical protein ILUMI_11331 [Ignelater luminosus]|uniref:Peptidase S1 domain-containing protein n=1 Tax=Ignelater luminosus TaxID=2038154 RepID=A0A8K0CYM5_IGNLU|nr:hypothetical protein ILUMI_11331 [Ignelater luminosus]